MGYFLFSSQYLIPVNFHLDWPLEVRGTLNELYQLPFGKNGKPFFIAGPYDNVEQILQQLETTVGQGNYDFLIGLP